MMDHAINSLAPFYEAEMDYVVDEYGSGEYKKISDCPSYEALKAIVIAMNALHKYMGWDRISIREEIYARIYG